MAVVLNSLSFYIKAGDCNVPNLTARWLRLFITDGKYQKLPGQKVAMVVQAVVPKGQPSTGSGTFNFFQLFFLHLQRVLNKVPHGVASLIKL